MNEEQNQSQPECHEHHYDVPTAPGKPTKASLPYKPVSQAIMEKTMEEIAVVVNDMIPDGFGFVLIATPMKSCEGVLTYTSTIAREDAMRVMWELIHRDITSKAREEQERIKGTSQGMN